MENYYKITKDDAAFIGNFEYASGKAIDPFVGEQNDGSYLISEKMYALLKEHEKFSKIDFEKKELISKEQLDTKIQEEIIIEGK